MSNDQETPETQGSLPLTAKARSFAARLKAGAQRRLADHRPGRQRAEMAELAAVTEEQRVDQAALAEEVGHLRDALAEVRAATAEEAARRGDLWEAARESQQTLNHLRAEVSSIRDFGKVLSSSRGWAGAADAYEELIYILHDLRRSVRDLDERTSGAGSPLTETIGSRPPDGAVTPWVGSDPYAGHHPKRFDYLGFERRFRGSIEDVTRTLIERYADELESKGPVLDLGCGRGELLAELHRRGVEVVGVEPHEPTAKEAREKGITVHAMTAGEFLTSQPQGSFGAIVTLQVVEHLVIDDLIEMLELSARALRPGGVFVAETPNPLTILTLHESYPMDPTHIQPIHPALMTFLTERAGFSRSDVRYHAPAKTLWFEHVEADGDPALAERLNQIIDRLNHQLYGPQDYAVWAYTPELKATEEPHPAP